MSSTSPEPESAIIIIDLNVRAEHGLTFAGTEDVVEGEVPEVGALVRVCELELCLAGTGEVVRVDNASQLIYLRVDWASLR